MLKSPMRFSSRAASIDVNPAAGSTTVVGVPAVDSSRVIRFLPGACDAAANTFTLPAHGIPEGTPISFLGSDLPNGITQYKTYWCQVIDADTIKAYLVAPGGAVDTFSDQGTGTHTLRVHAWAKVALFTNFGAYPAVVAPCYDASYTISDTDVHPIVSPESAVPFILDVFGYKCLAFEGVGGTTDVRVTPLENY